MQIVINIDEATYIKAKKQGVITDRTVVNAIASGTPLLRIRAEIDGLVYYWCEVNPRSVIDDVLKIIDKYTTESEEVK